MPRPVNSSITVGRPHIVNLSARYSPLRGGEDLTSANSGLVPGFENVVEENTPEGELSGSLTGWKPSLFITYPYPMPVSGSANPNEPPAPGVPNALSEEPKTSTERVCKSQGRTTCRRTSPCRELRSSVVSHSP